LVAKGANCQAYASYSIAPIWILIQQHVVIAFVQLL